MRSSAARRSARSAALPIAAGLVALAAAAPAQPLRWSILASARDARDLEMVAFDERLDRRLIETLNSSDIFEGRLEPVAAGIAELLTARSAFASATLLQQGDLDQRDCRSATWRTSSGPSSATG